MIKFFKKIIESFKEYLSQVGRGLDEIRDRGLGPKS
jgi:hypothetical protein